MHARLTCDELYFTFGDSVSLSDHPFCLARSIPANTQKKTSTSKLLTYQTARAYEQCNKKVTRRRQHAAGQQLQFAVQSGEAGRTQALVLLGRTVVATASAILAREPLALVLVDALAAGHFEAGRTTAGVRAKPDTGADNVCVWFGCCCLLYSSGVGFLVVG